MNKKAHRSRPSSSLRARAEGSLRQLTQGKNAAPEQDVHRMLHDLQVHEIELQMQNEELRRTQEELQEAVERYASLYDFAPCAYLTLGPKGEIREANLAAAHMLGLERRHLIRRKFSSFIHDDSQDEFFLYGRLLQSSGTRQTEQLAIKGAQGARTIVRIDGVAEERSPREEPRFRVSLTDITLAKRAEETLQSSEKDLTEFFENAPIGLQWLSRDGTVLRANRAQLELLGLTAGDYIGHRFPEFAREPKAANEMIHRLGGRETIRNLRTRLRHRDGGIRFVLMDAKSYWKENRFIHASVFTRDITKRVELEQELLQICEREQRRIAQDLHDDLGQILTASIHLSTALHKRLAQESLPEAADEARILALLDQALAQTRSLARGLHPVKAEPNGLMSALEELASRTELLYHYPCCFSCRRPVFIEDNDTATHLYRITQEAVTNAVKHSKPTRIDIKLSQNGQEICLLVRDDGIGLPEKPPKKGGMGLRIMQYRAGMIGGLLAIQKVPQGGTEVSCSLHLAKIARKD
jgi:PAS domain S-box-containing protein